MAGSVREVRPGVWEMRLYTGKDPLTGKKTQASRHVRASGKREAQAQCDRWAIELADGDSVVAAGTFGDLAAQWIAVNQRRWPPNTLQEHGGSSPATCVRCMTSTSRRSPPTPSTSSMRSWAPVGARAPTAPARWRHALNTGPGARDRSARAPACPHEGACQSWTPCDDQPCRHSAPLSAARVNRIHTVVRSALGQAVKWGWIRRNPADYAEPGEILEQEVEPPANIDVIQLLAEAEEIDHRLALFLQLAIVTGARRGALCALRWDHLDLAPATASARFTAPSAPAARSLLIPTLSPRS